jgi:hypothetical protein
MLQTVPFTASETGAAFAAVRLATKRNEADPFTGIFGIPGCVLRADSLPVLSDDGVPEAAALEYQSMP